jgi:hypothetical protein
MGSHGSNAKRSIDKANPGRFTMSRAYVNVSLHKVFLVMLAALLVCPSVAAAQDDVQLGYSFEPGFTQKCKCEFTQSQDFYGMNYVIIVEMELTENCVEALGDTAYKMEVVFDEVSSSMTMNDDLMPNNFDEAFKGQTVSYEVDKNGEVSEVKAKSYIEGWRMFGETVKMVISGYYPHLPNKAVKPGEKWDEETTENPEESPGLEVVTKRSYDFKEMKKEKDHECASIRTKSSSTFTGTITTPQGELNTDGESESEAEFYFDPTGAGIVKFKVKTQTDAKMIKAADSPGGKDEELEMHRSYEIKKELK